MSYDFTRLADDVNIEDFVEVLGSPRKFIEEFCYITTKDGEFKKFELNYPQSKLMDIVEEKLEKREPVRIRVLKARQMGFSTLISALGFWWSAMNENSSYAVVAHKESSANAIFTKNRIFYNNLPEPIKPRTNKMNSEQISFDTDRGDGLRSKIFFGTAGGGELFRGETILFMHKSEIAFWEDKQGVLKKSLNATVPYSPFSAVIEETTANGYNQFKDDWDRSVRGEDSYVPLFVGWNEMVEYQLVPPKDFVLTDKELQMQMDYDLTDAQLYWRRRKIADDYGDNELWFQQEYPLTPEEAFISSGMGVFDGELLKEGYRLCSKPIKTVKLKTVLCREPLYIWSEPESKTMKEYQKLSRWSDELQDYEYYDSDIEIAEKTVYANYTLGVDTSGLGADINQIIVWHNIDKRMVARFSKETMSEKDLALACVEIAKYYNDAMIAPEVNFSHSVCDYIIDLDYKHMYFTENVARMDKKSGTREYGWKTTKLTKAPAISTLRETLIANPGCIPDKDFWYEAEYYVLENPATNVMNAVSGHHDDIIMACAIANYVSNSFQSKQVYSTRTKSNDIQYNDYDIINLGIGVKPKKKTNRLKKGVYNNHA